MMRASALGLVVGIGLLCAAVATAQTARDVRGAPGAVPLAAEEPPARIVIDPPLPDALARGVAIIQYRTEHIRILPVFGPKALDVSPRVGHIHVTVDDAPWRWADTSGEPIIVNGLPPGPHKIRIDVVDANHRLLDGGSVSFVIPAMASPPTSR